jgi:putative transcriptional regulator
MLENTLNLTNHFLIAMPTMDDPNFFQTVTYICEHTSAGALGIIINRPTTIKLTEILEQMNIKVAGESLNEQHILYGGPIHQERGFVIHPPFGSWRSSFHTSDLLSVTTSRDILEAIAENKGPSKMLVALGFAGWEAGQLEKEMSENIWLSCPANIDILFNTPFSDRWHAAAKLINIDLGSMSGDVGHA